MISRDFLTGQDIADHAFSGAYKGKKVFITGHTGFKGSWLTLWLIASGADVYGYALLPPTQPAMFDLLELNEFIHHDIADIRDYIRLKESISRIKPDIIFHLAAQSVVSESYHSPLETIYVNTLGTVNILEAVRETGIETSLVLVTSDKCYENKEWLHGYRETDPLGGHDPYSASKGAAEILINSWRSSFFKNFSVRIASVRSGNVVGGGDWTKDQLVPDCIRDLQNENLVHVRNPGATRPWQHVLEPVYGYLLLGARLMECPIEAAPEYCSAFNFGPHVNSNRTVQDVVEKVIQYWGTGTWRHTSVAEHNSFHEASLLNLSFDKAYHQLNWSPTWNFDETILRTVEWYKVADKTSYRIREFTLEQIRDYQQALKHAIHERNFISNSYQIKEE